LPMANIRQESEFPTVRHHCNSPSRCFANDCGCVLVDLKLVFDRLLDGQITRVGAFQDTIGV
jgi:hypothetical protein